MALHALPGKLDACVALEMAVAYLKVVKHRSAARPKEGRHLRLRPMRTGNASSV